MLPRPATIAEVSQDLALATVDVVMVNERGLMGDKTGTIEPVANVEEGKLLRVIAPAVTIYSASVTKT